MSTDPDVWGRVWHVPTAAPRTQRQVVADVARLRGALPAKVVPLNPWLRTALRVLPTVRSLDETKHQFERPFVLDSTAAQERFGLEPTPMDRALAATLAVVGSGLETAGRA